VYWAMRDSFSAVISYTNKSTTLKYMRIILSTTYFQCDIESRRFNECVVVSFRLYGITGGPQVSQSPMNISALTLKTSMRVYQPKERFIRTSCVSISRWAWLKRSRTSATRAVSACNLASADAAFSCQCLRERETK
jgi:hypothetical protein